MTTKEEEFLAHYGVKGMRWGKRKSGATSPGSDGNGSKAEGGSSTGTNIQGKKAKPSSQEIREARARQAVRERKYEEANGEFMYARSKKAEEKAEKLMRQLENDYFNSPDAAIAKRKTRGEKVVVGLQYVAIGTMLAGAATGKVR